MDIRAELGIDGNCGFALLGDNLQAGEAEFVEIDNNNDRLTSWNEITAAKKAFLKLRERLGMPELSFYFGLSHPYGG